MHENAAAAFTLATAVVVAVVGTIYQADTPPPDCGSAACAARSAPDEADPAPGLQASVHRAIRQTEQGFLQLAGLSPAPRGPQPPVAAALPTHPSHPGAAAARGLADCDEEPEQEQTRGC